MLEFVAGFCFLYNPLMASVPKNIEQVKANIVYETLEELRRQIKSMNVDKTIVIGDGHCYNFNALAVYPHW